MAAAFALALRFMLPRKQPVQRKAPYSKEKQTTPQGDPTPDHGTTGLAWQAAHYRPVSFYILFWKTIGIVGIYEQKPCDAKNDY